MSSPGSAGSPTHVSLEWGLEGKPIIVTGASSGIGHATARALGGVGASVVLVGRDRDRLAACATEVEARGGQSKTVIAELSDPSQAEGVVDQALEAFGSLHGIVHSASLFDPRPIEDTTFESLEAQWRTNVAAPLLMTRAALPHLGDGSSVVFISSTVATVGFPGCSAYTATKGAVNGIAQQLAVELAPRGIRVNTIVPGYVRTPMLQPHLDANEGYEDWIIERTPLKRIAPPEELATTIVFMLSGMTEYVHGATLVADGGWVAQ